MKKLDLKQLGSKVNEAAKGTLEKSVDASKKAAVVVQKGTMDLSDKMKSANYLSQMKKYNPLFPDTYFSDTFNIPNIIKIVDDAERRGIEVCVGAIGWLGKVNNVEMLYLYDEFVNESGLTFVPVAQCDAVYYIDAFDKKRFLRSDVIYSTAHEEQVAELRHVAQMLGAKRCIIEIKESNKEFLETKKSVSVQEKKDITASAKEGYDVNSLSNKSYQQKGAIVAEFEGACEPERPELKWFAHNNSIKTLIDNKMTGKNTLKREELSFSGMSYSAVSQQAASAIDSAMGGIKIKANASLSKQMKKELNKEMHFIIEF